MHIIDLTIKNIYSFEDSHFSFDEYNVIVGTNNVGKTNLIRLLKLLVKSGAMHQFELFKQTKLVQNKPASLTLTLQLTNFEAKLIIQTLFSRHIDESSIPENFKTLKIMINWSDTVSDNPPPTQVTYAFNDDLVLTTIDYTGGFFFITALSDERKKNLFDSILDLKYSNWDYLIDELHKEGVYHKGDLGIEEDRLEKLLIGDGYDEDFLSEGTYPFLYSTRLQLEYSSGTPKMYASEVVEYMKQRKDGNTTVDFNRLIIQIIKNNLVVIEEIHPTYNELTSSLFRLKSENEPAYTDLQNSFSSIFNGVSVRVEQRSNDNDKQMIILTENKREFLLEESASGHYAAIHILQLILKQPERVLLLDEPEVHFHPVKISQLAQKFMELSEKYNNQIIIISHSPKFLDFKLMDSKKPYSVTFVKKENGKTSVQSTPKDLDLELKPHLFNPEIFFGNCTMIVEGAADEFALRAMSDHYGGIFEANSITLMNCWGVGNVYPTIELHNFFHVPFEALVDKEYDKEMNGVTKLKGNLESELRDLGWTSSSKKATAESYDFVSNLVNTKDGLKKLKKTDLWKAFATVITKSGGKLPS